ncbi:MAG: hypothetical protein HZB56_01790 [Deltaproteobacteria bacterium]|nr:hypothetical protein [Deltaproteobacteria bacterium]
MKEELIQLMQSDWSASPWFTQGEDEIFTAMGFPLHARRDAVAHLRRVFTTEVCREIAVDPKRFYGKAALFFQECWPGLLVPLLDVGTDLGVTQPWSDEGLLKRLTRRATFDDAAFELRVLSNLLRGRYPARRIPEAPPQKTPDLEVQVGLDRYEVELKAVNDSPLDVAAETINEQLLRADVIAPGLHLELRGSEELAERAFEDLDGVLAEARAVVAAYEACVSGIRREGAKPGVYEAPPYGTIHAVSGPEGGSVTPVVLPALPDYKRINKLVRLVRDACRQFSRRKGVAVVGVHRTADMLDTSEAIKAAAAADPAAFSKCQMVVLVDSVKDPNREYGAIPLVVAVQVHARRELSKALVRMAAVAAGRRGRSASFIRRTLPGEEGFAMGTVRRAMTAATIPADGKIDVGKMIPGAASK